MRRVAAAAIVLVLAAGCGAARPASKAPSKPSPAQRIQVACLQRNQELRQLSQPRTRADFAFYVASMLNIVRYYRGQLAAVHPRNATQEFARYRRLIRADEASAVALLDASHRGNRHALRSLLARQRDRSVLEQALLRRLGVSC